jgi:5-methylcytosine-specific restriction endonuclease McrA
VKAAKERFADRNGRTYKRHHGNPERKAAKAAGLIRYSTGGPCRNRHTSERYTFNGKCITCEAEKHARWLAARPGLETEWVRKRRDKDREPSRAAARRWYANNREKAAEVLKRWIAKNPERNRQIHRAATSRHRTRVAGNGGTFTADDIVALIEKQRKCCAGCGKRSPNLEVDHIISVEKGGSSDPTNLQLLCRSCNASKGSKDAIAWAQSKGRLM